MYLKYITHIPVNLGPLHVCFCPKNILKMKVYSHTRFNTNQCETLLYTIERGQRERKTE